MVTLLARGAQPAKVRAPSKVGKTVYFFMNMGWMNSCRNSSAKQKKPEEAAA
jgi:hypothetical protein